jgi:hypothetical protein
MQEMRGFQKEYLDFIGCSVAGCILDLYIGVL